MHNADYLDLDGRLAFVETWAGAGPTVLCIHTAGQSGVQYRQVAPDLAELGYSVVVADLPGHGRSEPAADGPISSLSWYAGWCTRLMAALRLERPYLLGCSIGGSIALDIATRMPGHVSGVVALDPSGVLGPDGPTPSPPVLEDSWSPSMRDRTYLGTIEACGRSVPAERAELIALMHCREDWHITVSDIHGAVTHDIRAELTKIICPVRVLTGEDDFFVPPSRVRRVADLIPHAIFELMPGIGHYPMEEIPDFARRFDGWVRDFDAAGVAAS
ncbi:alpha/beta hydrolase [Spongiactinospora sp. TRM90649]|uniref:alpha/beta hydrolase n=1 Tax=Spongiactinospora sp. TRM90649 TaxID=3031114 RepID=UPI0023F6EA8C|nr:alpha/beta hydrolase [Spongiactinospora sp. TRM90649]MDF5757719.1 alpha/beta hydrolase [Spongiactinospora sp. TRM90649]